MTSSTSFKRRSLSSIFFSNYQVKKKNPGQKAYRDFVYMGVKYIVL
ncbi:hypothetical protein WCP94_003431 [Bilophila wadsworthia]